MADAYLPVLDDLVLSQEELTAIELAMGTESPWDIDNEEISSAKTKIRNHHLARQGNTCCYCRTNLHGAGHFMIDREHILPKKKYRRFTYTIWNLSVSCKRCNMELKREDDEFVIDKGDGAEFQSNENYLIVHPNFDRWDFHLERIMVQVNTRMLVHYRSVNGSEKGRYTYEYFFLRDLEVDSFDVGQGVDRRDQNEGAAALAARMIAREHGQ